MGGRALTVLERVERAGISEGRALAYIVAGWVRSRGAVVTDPAAELPSSEPWALVDPDMG